MAANCHNSKGRCSLQIFIGTKRSSCCVAAYHFHLCNVAIVLRPPVVLLLLSLPVKQATRLLTSFRYSLNFCPEMALGKFPSYFAMIFLTTLCNGITTSLPVFYCSIVKYPSAICCGVNRLKSENSFRLFNATLYCFADSGDTIFPLFVILPPLAVWRMKFS